MNRNQISKNLFVLNIIILFINYFLFLKKTNNILLKKLHFKFIDLFLLKNYFIKSNFYDIETNNKRKNKTIVLYFEDIFIRTVFNIIKMLEKKKYNVKISSDHPDYLIYNVFGCNHLKKIYNNSIKIAYYTENQIPDFTIADYAISQHHIHYYDRYFKFPHFLNILIRLKNKFDYIRNKNLNIKKKKFCAAVISNYKSTDKFRLKFIKELNKYKKVDMGGKYNNNVGKINNKIEFFSLYKFTIAMENSEGDGYASEKIIDSFLSGSIPIYYGDYMIDEYINPKSFILIRGEKDMIKKINYIKKIDNNEQLYNNILKEKILINKNISNCIFREYYEFLLHIFEQDKSKAKRINNYRNNPY